MDAGARIERDGCHTHSTSRAPPPDASSSNSHTECQTAPNIADTMHAREMRMEMVRLDAWMVSERHMC